MDFELISQWMHYFLEWIGFGTLVGLLAKPVLPGKDGGGAFATVALGIIGTVVGAALLSFFVQGAQVKPISLLGFVVAFGRSPESEPCTLQISAPGAVSSVQVIDQFSSFVMLAEGVCAAATIGVGAVLDSAEVNDDGDETKDPE